MKKGEKTCPQCAETIKFDALVCRFCSTTFSADDIANLIKVEAAKQKKAAELRLIKKSTMRY